MTKFFIWAVAFLLPAAAAQAQTWTAIGNESQVATVAADYTSIAAVDVITDEDFYAAVPYVAFTEGGIAKVKRYLNGEWVSVGGNVSEGNASYTYIFTDAAGNVYVNYVDESATGANRLALKKYNAATSTWEPLGGDAANLYLSNGNIKQNNGSQLNSSHNSWMDFDSNNMPYVIYSEFGTSGGNPFVKRFNGTAWELVGTGAISTDKAPGVGIVLDKTTNTPYVVYLGGTGTTAPLKVYSFTDGAWQPIAMPTTPVTTSSGNTYQTINGATSGAINASRHSAITLDQDNNIYIGYFNAGNGNRATVIKYDRAAARWLLSGTFGVTSTYINMARNHEDAVYVSYISNANTAHVHKQKLGDAQWNELLSGTAGSIDTGTSALDFAVGSNKQEIVTYTKVNSSGVRTPVVQLFRPQAVEEDETPTGPDEVVTTPRKMEDLGRGVVAINQGSGNVFVSWRMLGTDPAAISFNLYRKTGEGEPVKIYSSGSNTNFSDTGVNMAQANAYFVRPVVNNIEQAPSESFILRANAPVEPFLSLPLQQIGDYYVHMAWVGDLTGDKEYDFVVNRIPNAAENTIKVEAYKRDGTFLWRLDLGHNSLNRNGIAGGPTAISNGQWDGLTVYDLDSDGKAEVAIKTANGVTFGDGTRFTHTNDRDQFISVLNGETGAERARILMPQDYLNVGPLQCLFNIAYLDGVHPSVVVVAKNRNANGSFNMVISAYDFRNNGLTERWKWLRGNRPNTADFHQVRIVDVDGDGKDEISPGGFVLNDNGQLLYGLKGVIHGDRFHITDMDPDRPGLEGYGIQQNNNSALAWYYYDAKTGEILRTQYTATPADLARGVAADVDPRTKGYEFWTFTDGIYTAGSTTRVSNTHPWPNFKIWWDGDLLAELLNENKIEKWNYTTGTTSRLLSAGNFGASFTWRGAPVFFGDIMGDWREEVIYEKSDRSMLQIFTTTTPTTHRLYTLAHNPAYRLCFSTKGYLQSTHVDYYLGDGMAQPPMPNIQIVPAGGVTSIQKDVDTAKQVLVYPNPTDATYTIAVHGNFTFTVYDQVGRTLQQGEGQHGASFGQDLKPGVYFVQVETNSGRSVQRLLKK